jgi:hypothetical protein
MLQREAGRYRRGFFTGVDSLQAWSLYRRGFFTGMDSLYIPFNGSLELGLDVRAKPYCMANTRVKSPDGISAVSSDLVIIILHSIY